MKDFHRLVSLLLMLHKASETLISEKVEAPCTAQPLRDVLGEIKTFLGYATLSNYFGITRQSVTAWDCGEKIIDRIPFLAIIHSELYGSEAIQNVISLYEFFEDVRAKCPTLEEARKMVEVAASQEPWSERLAVGEFRNAYREAQRQANIPNRQLLELAAWVR